MPREVVGSMSEWSGVLKDFFRQIEDGSHSLEAVKAFNERRNPFESPVREVEIVPPPVPPLPAELDWQKTYEALGVLLVELTTELSKVDNSASEGHWTVPVLKFCKTEKDEDDNDVQVPLVTCNQVVVALKKAGSAVYQYVDDLDKDVMENDHDPYRDGNYAIQIKATVEADEENKNKSAKTLKEEGHQGMTLLERLLMELAYFLTTGQHLDIVNITLCAGSRYRGGGVPGVFWLVSRRRVCVHRCNAGLHDDSIRSRSVRVLPALASEAQPEQATRVAR